MPVNQQKTLNYEALRCSPRHSIHLLRELFRDVADHDVDDLLLEELGDVVDHGEGQRGDELW